MRSRSLVLDFGNSVVLLVGILLLPGTRASAIGADGGIVAAGAKVERLADGFAFTEGPAADARGNEFFTVYLTGKGVTVGTVPIFVSAKMGLSSLPRIIAVDEPWTANVCFGGRDRQTLFITASRGLYAVRTRTKGVGSQ